MKVVLLLCFVFSSSFVFSKEWTWVDDLSSPINTNAKYIVYGGLAATTSVYFNRDLSRYKKRQSYDEAKPFGDYGFVGDLLGFGVLNSLYLIGNYSHGYFYKSESSYNNFDHMLKASAYTLGLTMILKKSISERRPGYPDDPDSFPSGHSSASFAFASVVAARHGWYYGAPAYLTALFVSFSRINDDFHYLHDVLFGATMGAAYGWGLYYNYESGRNYQFVPQYIDDGAKLSVVWNY